MGKAAAKRPAAKGGRGRRGRHGLRASLNARNAGGGAGWEVAGRLLLVRPAPSGRRASRNCVRKGPVRCHPPLCSCRLLPPVPAGWSRCGRRRRGWSGRGRANWNVGPYAWGATRKKVAGGGVGLGRSGWVGRRREVGPGLSIPRKRQDGRTRNRWCKRLPSSRKPLCLPRRPCHPPGPVCSSASCCRITASPPVFHPLAPRPGTFERLLQSARGGPPPKAPGDLRRRGKVSG